MANGNGTKWSIWMAGIIATLLIGAVSTLAASVVTNDKASRDRDITQTKETSNVQADVREIKTDIKYLREGVIEQRSDMRELKQMVQNISSKL